LPTRRWMIRSTGFTRPHVAAVAGAVAVVVAAAPAASVE
jgi:hypothetical protein